MLGTLVAYAFYRYARAIQRQFGVGVARWMLLLTATQFHIMFYASRSLPNIYALIFGIQF